MNASNKTSIFLSKDDSRAMNEFISNLILSCKHQDVAKVVVDFIYDLESERSGLAKQRILSFA